MTNTTIPEYLSEQLITFADDLKERMGSNLVFVAAYGSLARGDFVEGVSDINILIVAELLPAETLRSAGAVVRQWEDRLPLAPIFATTSYMKNSVDVFPLEFLDMRAWHYPLLGVDLLQDLHVDMHYLRHQVESELRGKLMRLRTAYARVAGHPRAVQELMRDSLSSFRTLFDGALRLEGREPPIHRMQVVRATAECYGLDATALEDVVSMSQNVHADSSGADELCGRYLRTIENLVRAVDAWHEKHDTPPA